MKNKQELSTLLDALENQVKELKRSLNHKSFSLEDGFGGMQELLRKISRFLGLDVDLENNRRIYEYIADFLSRKLDENIDICREATYLLCKENDEFLVTHDFPESEVNKIVLNAKKKLLSIKVHYDWSASSQICHCKTEIFSHDLNNLKPMITRIEEEISWESIPSNVREQFIRNDECELISFELYP